MAFIMDIDLEKLTSRSRKPWDSTPSTPSHPLTLNHSEHDDRTRRRPGQTRWKYLIDGFKRDPHAKVTPGNVIRGGRQPYSVEQAASATARTPLARRLKARHLQMIAIGGSIGTGLFVGTGSALATGGPGSLLIAFVLIGLMIFCTVHSLGEMAVLFPVAGSFSAYSTRFLDPAWGFAMGWNYALQWLVALPIEITAASFTITYWDPNNSRLHPSIWVIVFLGLIILINLCGIKVYGEAEYIFSIIKVVAVVAFIILGVVLCSGSSEQMGFKAGATWVDPGAFNHGFKGLCSVFTTAAFAFSGTELVGLAAAEASNPRKSLPMAVKQVFWRISLFYVISLALVGLLVRYDDERLVRGTGMADVRASPFVIAINQAGIAVLPSAFNSVILIAVLSVGNSSVFGSSRTLAALADQGQAPRLLSYIDRRGRPLLSILLASLVGFLGFFAGSDKRELVFEWLMALSGLSSVFTWGSICLAHIRFRRAWKMQGHKVGELAFRSQAGVAGSWIGFGMNAVVLVAQFWTGFAPVGYEGMSVRERVRSWFSVYMALPVVLAFYLPYKLWNRTRIVGAREMDLRTGVREGNLRELVEEVKEEEREWGRARRIYNFFF
ncbi:MAG: glyceraldehyde-3-phosphate dehydrogenase 1 [Alyxoria varia]|nr:MAG: glyceraldehyde-3-phosphate dehydrogenase 1 [Alyxoria varia]